MDPIDVVSRFGAAWADHDLDLALSWLTDDCIFDATGPAPDGETFTGPDQIRAIWEPIFADRASRFEVERTVAGGDHVVQFWRYSWEGGHVRGIDFFSVRGERVAEKRSYVKG